MKINPQALNNLNSSKDIQEKKPKDSRELIPEPYVEAARGMEEQFLEFMIAQMKTSIDKAEDGSTAMDYYEELITHEQASQIAGSNGGLGVQKLILDQIYPENMRNQMNYDNFIKQQEALNRYKGNVSKAQGRD